MFCFIEVILSPYTAMNYNLVLTEVDKDFILVILRQSVLFHEGDSESVYSN